MDFTSLKRLFKIVKCVPKFISLLRKHFFVKRVEKVLNLPYQNDDKFIEKLNNAQSSWRAGSYPELGKMTYEQVLRRSGFGNGKIVRWVLLF